MNIKTGIGQDSHPFEKKTGKPILIMGQTDQIKTSKGVTKAWKNENCTYAK